MQHKRKVEVVEPNGSYCRGSSSRFFKIILPSVIHEKKLRIPETFVRKYGDELFAVAKLTVPTGCVSRLGLEKADKKIWFSKGWQQFMEHHSIGCYYLLVFKYKGKSSFDVLIFDLSASEIQYPCSICCNSEERDNIKQCRLSGEEDIEDDESVQILGSSAFVGSSSKSRPGLDKKGKGAALGESSKPTCRYLTRSKRNEIENLNEVCGRRPSTSKMSKRETSSCHASVLGKSKKANQHVTKDVENLQALDDRGARLNCSELNVKVEKIDVEVQHPTKRAKISQMASQRTISHWNDSLVKHEVSEEMFRPKTCSICRSRGRPRKNQTSEMAINAARMFKPTNPFLMVILRPYNVKRVNIPPEFAKKLLHLPGVSAVVKLQVSDGRHWHVGAIPERRQGCGHWAFLSKGWPKFVKDNNLVKGDICVFELVNVKDIALNVSIFRTVAYAGEAYQPSGVAPI